MKNYDSLDENTLQELPTLRKIYARNMLALKCFMFDEISLVQAGLECRLFNNQDKVEFGDIKID